MSSLVFQKRSEALRDTGVVYSVTESSGITALNFPPTTTMCIADLDVELENFVDGNVNASLLEPNTVGIFLPPDIFANQTANETSVVFSTFNSSELYPLFNKTFPEFGVASSVVSATVVGSERAISGNITIILRLNIKVAYSWEQ